MQLCADPVRDDQPTGVVVGVEQHLDDALNLLVYVKLVPLLKVVVAVILLLLF